MLDFRIYTFIELCKTMNYTKTAENLYITQPAVSQHIKYLEEYYKCRLFNYSNRVLTLTEQGAYLYKHLLTMNSDELKLKNRVKEIGSEMKNISFGTTLTIGEYVGKDIILKFTKDYPNINIKLVIKDTVELLEELKSGKIEFALIEGFFEKTEYESLNFSKENFIGVCSYKNKLSKGKVDFEDLLNERIIVREMGSGSRDIFEKILYDNNLSLKNFEKIYEIANIRVIKELVELDQGITFIYEQAVKDELKEKKLVKIPLKNFNVQREFNFVFLKNSIHFDEYKNWFLNLKA